VAAPGFDCAGGSKSPKNKPLALTSHDGRHAYDRSHIRIQTLVIASPALESRKHKSGAYLFECTLKLR
jgi:hypothetical protein